MCMLLATLSLSLSSKVKCYLPGKLLAPPEFCPRYHTAEVTTTTRSSPLPPLHPYPVLYINNGRRPREISPPLPRQRPPKGSPPQPRHVSHPTRIDHHDMAQSERGTAAGRETDNTGEAEYRSGKEGCAGHFLRKCDTMKCRMACHRHGRHHTDSAHRTATTPPHPQTLRSPSRTLRKPTRRLHSRPAHRAHQRGPSRIRHSRTRRRT